MVTFELREMVKSTVSNRIEVIKTFDEPYERLAKKAYEDKSATYPATYFELVRVERNERLISFTPYR